MFSISIVNYGSSLATEVVREDFTVDGFNPRRVVDFLDLLHVSVCLPVAGSDPVFIRTFWGRFLIEDCYVCIHDLGCSAPVHDFPLRDIMFSRDSFSSFLDSVRKLYVDRYDGVLGGDLNGPVQDLVCDD